MVEKDSEIVSIRLPKHIIRAYEQINPASYRAAMRRVIEDALINPVYLDAKMLEIQGQMAQYEKLKEISPMAKEFEFSKTLDLFFQSTYTQAISKRNPDIFLTVVWRGYNMRANTKLTKTQYTKIARTWCKKKQLPIPGSDAWKKENNITDEQIKGAIVGAQR